MSDDETLRTLAKVVAARSGQTRPEQEQMAVAVTDTLTGDSNLVVQAGTGVGKSLGYLVPVMLRAAQTDTTQLISTSSLALQRQIINQDAPLVRDVLAGEGKNEVSFALLKGWSNYLCRFRLAGGFGADEMLWEEADEARLGQEQVEQLREWADETTTGDRDDVPFAVGASAWNQVSVTRRECLRSSCPYLAECFPEAARERAFQSNVVVTNHALLGVYANGRSDVLPEFTGLVVDEAHDLPNRVRSQGTQQLTAGAVSSAARAVRTVSGSAAADLEEARDRMQAALDQLEPGLLTLRTESLHQNIRDLDSVVGQCRQELTASSSAKNVAEVQLARAKLEALQDVLDAWAADTESTITWISETVAGTNRLNIAPLDVSSLLQSNLFSDHPTVLTSATLALGGTFDQFAFQSGIGLSSRPCVFLDVGTSFDTKQQGILYAAAHLPPPGREGISAEAADEFVALVEAAGGGALGLFSSQRGAQAAAERLRADTELRVLLQGEDSISALVEEFRADRDAVLVGTLSLWQGVDVPGEACRLVVIDRIPFARPDDPVVQAQQRAVARQERNPFLEVTLAPAALLMAQGAGRLLRSATDKGVVAILDSRIATKSYGGFIYRSLLPYWNTQNPQVVRDALQRLGRGDPNSL